MSKQSATYTKRFWKWQETRGEARTRHAENAPAGAVECIEELPLSGQRVAILEFREHGHSATYYGEPGQVWCASHHGYQKPETWSPVRDAWTDTPVDDYKGAVVIDWTPLESGSLHFPMASPGVPAGAVHECPKGTTFEQADEGLFGSLARLAAAGWRGLDFVNHEDLAILARANGARVGRVCNWVIVWAD